MKLGHLLNPKKCFSSAAWIGNLYACPVCGKNIACGVNGKIYALPPYNLYTDLVNKIPKQPEWYFEQDGWEEVHRFMKEILTSIGDFDDDIDEPEEESEETDE